MAGNEAPRDSDKLQQALEKAVIGATSHAATLNLKHDATRLNNARQTLFDTEVALDKAQNAFDGADHNRALKDNEIEAFVKTLKEALVYNFGPEFGPVYHEAGFPDNTTEIPDDSSGRHAIFARIPGLLTDYPQLVNAAKNLTVARATALGTEWTGVLGVLTNKEGLKDTAETARNNAFKAARKVFIGLVDELDEELSSNDIIWWDFGLNRPDDPATPDAPDAPPTVAALGAGTIYVSSLILPRRADACFVRTQIVGEQNEPHPASDRVLDDTTLINQPSGKTLRVFYCGVNEDGTGPLSPFAEIVVL